MHIDKNLVSGVGIGASLMYMLDPSSGHRRRALVADQLRHVMRVALHLLAKSSRDFNHRTRGLFNETYSRFKVEHVPDHILVERVRSKIGRVVSHPHAIGVSARAGCVTISGPILAEQSESLIHCVARVRGVSSVKNMLEVHSVGEHRSYLAGAPYRRKAHALSAPRLLSGLIVSSLVASEVIFTRRKNVLGSVLSASALLLYVRGFDDPDWLLGKARSSTAARMISRSTWPSVGT